MNPRLLAIVCGGLVVLRAALPAHAPALVDAHAALVAMALLVVAPTAPFAWRVAAAIIGAVVVSVVGSWDPWISVLALPVVVGPVAFFCLATGSGDEVRRGMLIGLASAGALNACIGLYQRAVLYPDTLRQAESLGLSASEMARLASARPLGMSLSPDLAGALSLAGVFAALALVATAPQGRGRALPGVAAAVSLVGVLLSRSVGCALALAVGLAVAALPRVGVRKTLAVGVLGLLPGLLALRVRGTEGLLLSVQERLDNYGTALRVFFDAPFIGVGLARFAPAYAAERLPGSNVTRYAHGALPQGLAETGALGLVCAVVALVVVAHAWRAAPRTPERALILGGAAAFCLRGLVDYDLQVGQTAALAATLFGLAAAPAPAPAPPGRAQKALAGVGSAAMLVLVVLLGMREAVLRAEAPSAEALRGLADRFPGDVEAQLAQARRDLDGLATCADATCAALEQDARTRLDALAARTHPPAAGLILRARLKAQTDDTNGALVDLDAALRVDPGSEAAHRLSLSLADELDLDTAPRLEAARRWGIRVGGEGP